MAQPVSVQCRFCQKRFQVKPELLGHAVRCPHCKTVMQVPPQSPLAIQAAAAMNEAIASEKEEKRKQPPGHHDDRRVQGGVRNKNVAIVWVAGIGVALVVVIVILVIVLVQNPSQTAAPKESAVAVGPGQAGFAMPSGSEAAVIAPAIAPIIGPAGTQDRAMGKAAPGAQTAGPRDTNEGTYPYEDFRILSGFQGSTVTYLASRIKNNSGEFVYGLKIVLALYDSNDKLVGKASTLLLNIPPGSSVPIVADWKHAEHALCRKWVMDEIVINPSQVSTNLPVLQAEDPWINRDPQTTTRGTVAVKVTNRGKVQVNQVELHVIFLGSDGRVVCAVKGVVDKSIPPGKSENVIITWEKPSGPPIASAQAWAQVPL